MCQDLLEKIENYKQTQSFKAIIEVCLNNF